MSGPNIFANSKLKTGMPNRTSCQRSSIMAQHIASITAWLGGWPGWRGCLVCGHAAASSETVGRCHFFRLRKSGSGG